MLMNYGSLEINTDLVFTANVKSTDGNVQLSHSLPLSEIQSDPRRRRHGLMCLIKNARQEFVVFLQHATDLLVNKKDWHVLLVLGTLTQVIAALLISALIRLSYRWTKRIG